MPGLVLETDSWPEAEALCHTLEELQRDGRLVIPFEIESKCEPAPPATPVATILCPTCAHEHRCLSLAVAEITLDTIRENSKELM